MPQPRRPDPPCPRHQLRRGNRLRLRAGRGEDRTSAHQPAAGEPAAVRASSRSSAFPADSATATTWRRPHPRQPDPAPSGRRSSPQFKAAGKLILGICNGFQVLIKSGVLLDADAEQGPGGHADAGTTRAGIEDRWVRLAVDGSKCVFLRGHRRRCICRWPMPRASSSPATPTCSRGSTPPANWCCATCG